MLLSDDELDELEPPVSRDVQVLRFCPAGTIGHAWYDRPYFLGPDDDADAYFALAAAMRHREVEAVVRWVIRKQEYVGALRPAGEHLVMMTLRHPGEVVSAATIEPPAARKPTDREAALARQLISALESEFDPTAFSDEYRDRVLELVEAKARGGMITPRIEEARPAAASLARALEASVRSAKAARSDCACSRRMASRSPAARGARAAQEPRHRPASVRAGAQHRPHLLRPRLLPRARRRIGEGLPPARRRDRARGARGHRDLRDARPRIPHRLFGENGILRAETLRFHDELRSTEDIDLPEPAKPSRTLVRKFEKAIDAATENDFDEAELNDDHADRLLQLVEEKQEAGNDVVHAPAGATDEEGDADVIDIMEAIKRRIRAAAAKTGTDARADGRSSGSTRKSRTGKSRDRSSSAADDLAAQSKDELYRRAQQLDIAGRSGMNKAELIRAIRKSA